MRCSKSALGDFQVWGERGRSDLGKDLGHAEHNSCVLMNESKDRRRSTFMHEQHSGAVSTSGEVLDRGVFPSSRAPLTSARRWRSNVHGDLEPKPWNLDPCE